MNFNETSLSKKLYLILLHNANVMRAGISSIHVLWHEGKHGFNTENGSAHFTFVSTGWPSSPFTHCIIISWVDPRVIEIATAHGTFTRNRFSKNFFSQIHSTDNWIGRARDWALDKSDLGGGWTKILRRYA